MKRTQIIQRVKDYSELLKGKDDHIIGLDVTFGDGYVLLLTYILADGEEEESRSVFESSERLIQHISKSVESLLKDKMDKHRQLLQEGKDYKIETELSFIYTDKGTDCLYFMIKDDTGRGMSTPTSYDKIEQFLDKEIDGLKNKLRNNA